jgi:choline dehydrogenase-like flavoprotein
MLGLFDHEVASLGGTTESSVFVSDYMLSHNFVIESSSITPGWMSTAFSLLSPEQTAKYVNHYRNAAIFGTILLDNSHVGEPDWSNRVVRKYDGEPSYEYGVIDRDRDNFAFGVAEAVRMFLLAGAREVVVPTNEAVLVDCGNPNNAHTAQCVNGDVQCQVTLDNPWDLPTFTSFEQAECLERYLQFVPNRTNLANFHLQGSCKLGPDPSNSVVGHDHRVHGTQNVYVMDSSVFPTTVGANPMQSIYSLSKLVAERIAGRVLSQ